MAGIKSRRMMRNACDEDLPKNSNEEDAYKHQTDAALDTGHLNGVEYRQGNEHLDQGGRVSKPR